MDRCRSCDRDLLSQLVGELTDSLCAMDSEKCAISESEVYFRTLFETTRDAVLLIDETGVFDCNPAAVSMFHVQDKGHVCGRKPAELSPPFQECGNDSALLADKHIALAQENGFHRFEWLARRSDGTDFPVQVSLVAIEIGGRKILQCVARDLTEQKAFESQLIAAHQEVAAVNWELKHALEELDRQASTDPLTGAKNRRYFNLMINAEIERARRYGQPLSVAILDVDHFKRVNDEYGHSTGDEVLAELARLMSSKIRASDCLVRWGGEEFTVLMPAIALDEAHAMAEKLRQLVEAHHFAEVGRVTVSLGVAQLEADEAMSEWLSRADEALYQAKARGRNTVVFL